MAILLQGIQYLIANLEQNNRDARIVLNEMKEAVHRADSVIRGLLDFSCLPRLSLAPEDLNFIIESSLLLVKDRQNDIEVLRDLSDDMPWLNLDRGRMKQVFVSIFMNAIEAMPDGGRLMVRSYTNSLPDRKRKIIAEIENTGPHIPEEILKNIFEPFVTTKQNMGRKGLGLSMAKNIMKMQNAEMEIANREGGVRVTLVFTHVVPNSARSIPLEPSDGPGLPGNDHYENT